jgi:hypothetical protein
MNVVCNLFLSISFLGLARSEEAICKKEMCGVVVSGNPNIYRTVTETIRVYVRYADLVESATCNKQGINIAIGSKKRDNDPCKTYVEIIVTSDNSGEQRLFEQGEISLFGNVLGVKTLTAKLIIGIWSPPPKVEKFDMLFNNMSALTQVYTNQTYRIVIQWSGNVYNYILDADQNDFEFLYVKSNSSLNVDTFYVKFKNNLTLPKSFSTIRWKTQNEICNKGDYVFRLPKNYTITELTGLPELLDAGLNRKFGSIAAVCSGNNVAKVSTNRTTLDIVRAQIPEPSAGTPLVYQEINWPDIRWGVKNLGASTLTSFTVQLKDGNTLLQSQNVNGLGSGEEKLFTYVRPKSKKKLYRKFDCNPEQDVFIFSTTPRSESDLRMMEPYIWSDPEKFTIVIDVHNNVLESNELNNTRDY